MYKCVGIGLFGALVISKVRIYLVVILQLIVNFSLTIVRFFCYFSNYFFYCFCFMIFSLVILFIHKGIFILMFGCVNFDDQ